MATFCFAFLGKNVPLCKIALRQFTYDIEVVDTGTIQTRYKLKWLLLKIEMIYFLFTSK